MTDIWNMLNDGRLEYVEGMSELERHCWRSRQSLIDSRSKFGNDECLEYVEGMTDVWNMLNDGSLEYSIPEELLDRQSLHHWHRHQAQVQSPNRQI